MLFALAGGASASAADLNLGAGTYTVDTTALTFSGPATNTMGTDQGGVAVFSFDNVSIPAGATLNVQGARPFKLLATGSLAMAGIINADGVSATDFTAAANPGGPGGGAGGSTTNVPGLGPGGGGGTADINNGGGGGGFGGAGARGGRVPANSSPVGTGGGSYGDLNASLQGGSGGGGGATTGGGGGGGAVALFGSSVTISGTVVARGGGGATGAGGASGGGSGGAILIHGDLVEVTGTLDASGGAGGLGGCCGDGGGGSGGRIAYQFKTLMASGTANTGGGASGVRTTSSCCPHGEGSSPDAAGFPGVVTKVIAPNATTGPATAVSATSATLNGTVNPNSNATSYYFEYGPTGSYGSKIPVASAAVGADGSDHVVSQTIPGLSPATTYHYRIVALDAVGLNAFGTDIGFTTPAVAAGPPPQPKPKPKHKKCKKGKKLKHGKCVRKKGHRHHKH
ncbi:MAG TPA: fibronectin type III domain-containing protein [Solirubrobacterales bacterium]|jgi:hypothetical protein|nr:fibronectin type III domain-containing protein [Solirubrobacterales bacterium]